MQDWHAEIPELINPDSEPLEMTEFCRVCRVDREILVEWVAEGVVEPVQGAAESWCFNARQVRRAHLARRLQRDLELETRGLPLVLDLLEEVRGLRREVALLQRQLRRGG